MNQQIKSSSLLLAGLCLCCGTSLFAANWPNWRGPNYDGSSDEKNLPAQFSKTENVKWVATMPGPSAATPVIWGDHVFMSSTDANAKTLRALALDRKTGKVLWDQEVSAGYNQDHMSTFSAPSPITDGQLVYFYYGNGALAAFDFAGKKIWARNIQQDYGDFAYQWTYSASPALVEGKLIIQVLQRNQPVHGKGRADGESYLLALDLKTGKELWKHVRPSEAKAESLESFATPIPFTYEGKVQLLVAGGDCITGHDLKSGEELWRWGTWNPTRIGHWRLVPSPVAGGGAVLACAPKGAPIYAVKQGGKGVLKDSDLAWTSKEREVSSDVCTPLFYKGRFYVVNGERSTKTISRVDPATGKADWIGELGPRAKIECSPMGVDDKIYFQNFKGEVFVVAAGPEFKVLHTTPMGDDGDDKLRAAIAVSQGNLFLRTGSKLYCIGK
ncbi:MAG TPA: PQQ-binding-like beta-propeller repeat protein [Verrucomicrobiae bacterium]|nr:PQQ-binding-like beta-propeller repeat protein [Verrucomicrobiae bacterium]